jgi:hypothetical protein
MPAPKSSGVLDYPNLETLLDRITPDDQVTFYTGLATYTLKDESFTYLIVLVVTETAQHRWRLPLDSDTDLRQRHRLLAILDDYLIHYYPAQTVSPVHALPENIVEDYRTGKREPYDDTATMALNRHNSDHYLTPHEWELLALYEDPPTLAKTPYDLFWAEHGQDINAIRGVASGWEKNATGIPATLIAEFKRLKSLHEYAPEYDCRSARLSAILWANGPDQTPLDQERRKANRAKANFVQRVQHHWQPKGEEATS